MRGKTVVCIEGNKMKKLFFGILLLALVIVVPIPTMAQVGINIRIALPPPIVFAAPPVLIVLPETYIYVVPDVDADIFFYNGWWWRLWQGRWYRSRNYSSGWRYYRSIPSFYAGIPSGWRNDYKEHRWGGHQWNYQRIPQQQLQQNWSNWEKSRHWEKQNTWGVQGLKPQTQLQQPSPAVQPQAQTVKPKSLKAAKPQQTRPQAQAVKPKSRKAAKTQQTRPQAQTVKPKSLKAAKPQQSKPQQGKPERGEEEKQDRK